MKHAAFSNAFNADFDEGKHKRDDSGRFSKSGGETHVKVDVVKSEAPSKQTSTPSKEKRLPQDLPLSRWERYIVSR